MSDQNRILSTCAAHYATDCLEGLQHTVAPSSETDWSMLLSDEWLALLDSLQ